MGKDEKCCPESYVVIRYFDNLLKIIRKYPEIRFYKEKWQIEEQLLKAKNRYNKMSAKIRFFL